MLSFSLTFRRGVSTCGRGPGVVRVWILRRLLWMGAMLVGDLMLLLWRLWLLWLLRWLWLRWLRWLRWWGMRCELWLRCRLSVAARYVT